jgi:hypothetical protein
MGRRDRRVGEAGHDIELCKMIFATWRWVVGIAVVIAAGAFAAGVTGQKQIFHMDNKNAEEVVQRTQADSSLSYRIARLEVYVKQIPGVSADMDTIKTLLRKKK